MVFASLLASGAGPDFQVPPNTKEQVATIGAARENALRFGDSLPDFICLQVTRRWVGKSGKKATINFGDPRTSELPQVTAVYPTKDWKLKDTLTVQLTYAQQKEQYQLLLVNGRRTKKTYESVGGATYYGDFWSVLGIVFQRSSQTDFEWDHWASVGGWKLMVFRFRVAAANSQWRLSYGSQQTVTGIDGLVYVEPTHNWVFKIKVNADAIPKKFPIQRSGAELDYRPQTVADREFVLPIRASEWNDSSEISTKNEVEFRRYKKFTIDSKIDYETPPPLPASEIKEVTEK